MQSQRLLGNEHDRIRDILSQLEEHSHSTVRIREKLFEKLLTMVIPHMQAEEFALQSVLGKNSEFTDELFVMIEEHQLLYSVVTEMKTISKLHERWGAKIRVLKDLLERHMDFEENEFFMIISESFAEEQLLRVTEIFTQYKSSFCTNLPA